MAADQEVSIVNLGAFTGDRTVNTGSPAVTYHMETEPDSNNSWTKEERLINFTIYKTAGSSLSESLYRIDVHSP